MKFSETVKAGLHYGVFSAITIAIPLTIAGAIYGCARIIHNTKERCKHKKNDVVLKSTDYKEVD